MLAAWRRGEDWYSGTMDGHPPDPLPPLPNSIAYFRAVGRGYILYASALFVLILQAIRTDVRDLTEIRAYWFMKSRKKGAGLFRTECKAHISFAALGPGFTKMRSDLNGGKVRARSLFRWQ